uniref:Uncharacterized protein n=1 Tax=Ciona savignyi TaxID=51511 RepID=H2ZLP0_CIOSA
MSCIEGRSVWSSAMRDIGLKTVRIKPITHLPKLIAKEEFYYREPQSKMISLNTSVLCILSMKGCSVQLTSSRKSLNFQY